MSLYVTTGRGAFAQRKMWIPGDPGTPTTADTKEELLSFCPKPGPSPCPRAECGNMRYVSAKGHQVKRPYWYWSQRACMRCENLRQHHGLTLVELIALWEAQDRRCYRCPAMLMDPRIATARRRGRMVIDHDHVICPRDLHSCKRCYRGLACNGCNTNKLARRLGDLPESNEERHRWLASLRPEERDWLRGALRDFPGGQ
jgi:Recombination endonuclease VII